MNSNTQEFALTAGGSLPSAFQMGLNGGTDNIQSCTIDNYSSLVLAVYGGQGVSGNPLFLVQPYTYKTLVGLNRNYLTLAFTGTIVQNVSYVFLEWDDNQSAQAQQGSLIITNTTGGMLTEINPGQTITAAQLGLTSIQGLILSNTSGGDTTVQLAENALAAGYRTLTLKDFIQIQFGCNPLESITLAATALGPITVYASAVPLSYASNTLGGGPSAGSIFIPNPIPGTRFGKRLTSVNPSYTVPANTTLYLSYACMSNESAASQIFALQLTSSMGIDLVNRKTVAIGDSFSFNFTPPIEILSGETIEYNDAGGLATLLVDLYGYTIP